MPLSANYPNKKEDGSRPASGTIHLTGIGSPSVLPSHYQWWQPRKYYWICHVLRWLLSRTISQCNTREITTFSFILGCLLTFSSCEKIVEAKKTDVLAGIVTNGRWQVENYLSGTEVITNQFAEFYFQFSMDGTVTGHNGAEITIGTWTGDIQNYSITANFPSAPDPLKKLNGTWKIKDSGMDYVKAEMEIARTIHLLQLRRQ